MSRESGVSRYVQDTPNGPSSSGTSLPEPPPYTQAEMRQGLSFDGQFYKITDAMWFDANNNPELFVRRFNAALGEDRELSQVLTRVACLDVSSLNNKQSYERILPALLGNDSTSPRPFGEITSIHFGQYRDAAISAGMLDKAKDYAGHPIVVKESDDKRTLSLVDTKMPAPSPQHRIFSDSEGRIPIDEQVAKNKAIDELSAGIESTPRGAVQAAQDPIATEQPKTSPAPTAPAPDAPASPSPAPSALAPEPAASLTADAPGADQDRSALPPAVTPLAQILSGMPPQPVSPVSPAAPSATAQPTPPVSVRDLDHASHASLTSIEGASVEAQSEVGDPVSLMPAAPLASAGREGDIEPLYKVEDLVMGPELRPKYIEGLREQELAAARSASPATASVLGEGTSDVESMSSSAASLTASPLAQAPLSGISPMQAAAGAPSDHTRASAVAGASSSIERWADEVASSVGERDSPVPPITAAVAKAIELEHEAAPDLREEVDPDDLVLGGDLFPPVIPAAQAASPAVSPATVSAQYKDGAQYGTTAPTPVAPSSPAGPATPPTVPPAPTAPSSGVSEIGLSRIRDEALAGRDEARAANTGSPETGRATASPEGPPALDAEDEEKAKKKKEGKEVTPTSSGTASSEEDKKKGDEASKAAAATAGSFFRSFGMALLAAVAIMAVVLTAGALIPVVGVGAGLLAMVAPVGIAYLAIKGMGSNETEQGKSGSGVSGPVPDLVSPEVSSRGMVKAVSKTANKEKDKDKEEGDKDKDKARPPEAAAASPAVGAAPETASPPSALPSASVSEGAGAAVTSTGPAAHGAAPSPRAPEPRYPRPGESDVDTPYNPRGPSPEASPLAPAPEAAVAPAPARDAQTPREASVDLPSGPPATPITGNILSRYATDGATLSSRVRTAGGGQLGGRGQG